MHEVAPETLARIFAESRRVLRRGGITLHQDVPIRGERSLFERFMFDWETRNNNEPFWQAYADADLHEMMRAAGFEPAQVAETLVPKLDGPGAWYVILGEKPLDQTGVA
jgi:hypothetical protein